MARAGSLIYDVLLLVLETLHDYSHLYRCSLVNRLFNQIASKVLYSQVVLSPPFRPVLDLKDRDGLLDGGRFVSSCLPQNAPYVQKLEITGFMSPRPPPRNTIGTHILRAVQCFHNLNAVKIAPTTFHTGIFTDTLLALRKCASLRHLTVNSACTDEAGSSAVVTIDGLHSLTLIDPTRAILNKLPDWLARLSGSLTALHLEDNCGSITPAVLRSFIPHIRTRVCSITLGLSYSLTDDDVFSFLGELPELTSVKLQYYLQLKVPTLTLFLPYLKSFTAKYVQMHTRVEVNRFCAWVRRVVLSSHNLHTLHLIGSNEKPSANVSFDALINHLSARHFGTLTVLDLGSAFIGEGALKQLCVACIHLEVLIAGVGWHTLMAFSTQRYASAMQKLHTISFSIRNVKRHKIAMDTQMAAEIIIQGPPQLRRLTVDGLQWEGCWESTRESLEAKFVVRETAQPMLSS